MNPKHRRFAEEYSVDHNGAQAAIRAGYSENRAKQTAYRLLARPDVARLISRLDAEVREQTGFDAVTFDSELERIYGLALAGAPRSYRTELVRGEDGQVVYVADLHVAIRALELRAKVAGILSDRTSVEVDGAVVYTLNLDRKLGDDAEDVA